MKSLLFRFRKHFNWAVLEVLYVHVAEVFAKAKSPGFPSLLSFNKCLISSLTAHIYQSIEKTL